MLIVTAHNVRREKDPSKYNKKNHEYRLKLYNLTPEDYQDILLVQGGVCGICRKLPTGKRLSVDHSHKTGLVRGLLCNRCNRLWGASWDNIEYLQSGIDYVKHPPATSTFGSPRYTFPGRIGTKRHRQWLKQKSKEVA